MFPLKHHFYLKSISKSSFERSLKKELEEEKSNIIDQAALAFATNGVKQAKKIYQEGLRIYYECHDLTFGALCFENIGLCWEIMGKTNQSKAYFEIAKKLALIKESQ